MAIDLNSGCVAYAELSVTGTMQYDTKLLAVPWQIFKFSPEWRRFTLAVPRALIENGPQIDPHHPPKGTAWLDEIYNYYGAALNSGR